MKCNLCKSNELDNTGSHYITESVARTAVSEEGKKGRDNEIMFSFSISTLGQNFIGRNINEEKIMELNGRAMTDAELAENENMLIDYNLVCRPCEKKFNPIETKFITNVLRSKIEKNSTESSLVLDENDYKVTLLFLLINIWRTSASSKPHYKIKGEYEEEIRIIIDQIEEDKIENIIDKIDFKSGLLSKIRFATYYLNQTTGQNSENQISITSDTNPHILILNQLVFLVFFEYPTNFEKPSLVSNFTSKNKIKTLLKGQPELLKVSYVSDEKRQKTLISIAKSQVKSLIKQVNYIVKTVHLELYGFEANREIYKATKSEISQLPREQLNLHSINLIIAKYLMLSGEYYKKWGIPK